MNLPEEINYEKWWIPGDGMMYNREYLPFKSSRTNVQLCKKKIWS